MYESTSQAAWADVLSLAFLYLDVDGDGFLNAEDLSMHLPGLDISLYIYGMYMYTML